MAQSSKQLTNDEWYNGITWTGIHSMTLGFLISSLVATTSSSPAIHATLTPKWHRLHLDFCTGRGEPKTYPRSCHNSDSYGGRKGSPVLSRWIQCPPISQKIALDALIPMSLMKTASALKLASHAWLRNMRTRPTSILPKSIFLVSVHENKSNYFIHNEVECDGKQESSWRLIHMIG